MDYRWSDIEELAGAIVGRLAAASGSGAWEKRSEDRIALDTAERFHRARCVAALEAAGKRPPTPARDRWAVSWAEYPLDELDSLVRSLGPIPGQQELL